jgi:hypothetical protein
MHVHEQAVLSAVTETRLALIHERPDMLEAEFRRRFGGLVPSGVESLQVALEPYIERWLRLADAGVLARESLEAMFERVEQTFRQWEIQVWHGEPPAELLIGDVPCITVRYADANTKAIPNVAIGDASTVLMPISKNCVISIAMSPSGETMHRETVQTINDLQVMSAFGFVYYRPGSPIRQYLNDAHPARA